RLRCGEVRGSVHAVRACTGGGAGGLAGLHARGRVAGVRVWGRGLERGDDPARGHVVAACEGYGVIGQRRGLRAERCRGDARQRAVYDSHRLALDMALDRPEAAVPMLEQSQKDFPDDYNPPQRLATAYKAMKKWPEALAASDAALARAYGPRQFLVLGTRADIQLGMGDKAAAEKTLADAVA